MKVQENSLTYLPSVKINHGRRSLAKSPRRTASKSEKLARLKRRQAKLWAALNGLPLSALSDSPEGRAWSKAFDQIKRLGETFVSYQGRDVEAPQVAYQSCDITITERHYITGEERLHRAADGTYYLWRETDGREYVHRLSLAAAILWSVTRANITNRAWRKDAAMALRATRNS